MLILTRRIGEKINIGADIVVTVLGLDGMPIIHYEDCLEAG